MLRQQTQQLWQSAYQQIWLQAVWRNEHFLSLVNPFSLQILATPQLLSDILTKSHEICEYDYLALRTLVYMKTVQGKI